ncbi:hypothetical protein CF327_g113 [Tilletia walkeri]|uniref:Uncharacterized protein n=1 Tax=Tilletia walkeri TaxID=117179 RepID=A0A8X7NB84_9BASI|nr:hypothetical protein CF327_g113 [Tilletia walkeri]KAE8269240.1 hypothetical protein A4X09_0g3107 [Tilletia walkeri]
MKTVNATLALALAVAASASAAEQPIFLVAPGPDGVQARDGGDAPIFLLANPGGASNVARSFDERDGGDTPVFLIANQGPAARDFNERDGGDTPVFLIANQGPAARNFDERDYGYAAGSGESMAARDNGNVPVLFLANPGAGGPTARSVEEDYGVYGGGNFARGEDGNVPVLLLANPGGGPVARDLGAEDYGVYGGGNFARGQDGNVPILLLADPKQRDIAARGAEDFVIAIPGLDGQHLATRDILSSDLESLLSSRGYTNTFDPSKLDQFNPDMLKESFIPVQSNGRPLFLPRGGSDAPVFLMMDPSQGQHARAADSVGFNSAIHPLA